MGKKITSANNFYKYATLSATANTAVIEGDLTYAPGYNEVLKGFIDIRSITTSLLHQPLDNSFNRTIKRSFDIIFSVVMIILLLSWLLPVIAILTWIDTRGPVFFFQKRNKRNGELFTCIKFRSMIVNQEADILPAQRNDKRITFIGCFLRNHYIDELPQFFNVLMGDMSVIGPRPHMISDNLNYRKQIDHYERRHKGKPGITGLAQVLGYVGATENIQEIKDRVGLDIFYLRHWSFKLDMIILYRTFRKLIGLPLTYNIK
jgi:putative colanic acid biosynthesis UDP-glucose lipid carrier transferase